MTVHQPSSRAVLERIIPATTPVTRWLHPARCLIALATLLTLALNPGGTLFHSSDPATSAAPECSGVPAIGLFCLAEDPDTARWIGVALLCPVLLGLFPPATGILHWYVAVSVFWTITPMEGGDQLAAVITLFLIPVCFSDTRLVVWSGSPRSGSRATHVVGNTALLLIAAQVVIVYANSAIAKFSSTPWVEGTALWYWMQHPAFGAPQWLYQPALDLLAQPAGAAVVTWGTIALELFVMATIFCCDRRIRRAGWVAGVFFHLVIAVVIGLVTFGMVMVGALTLALLVRPAAGQTERQHPDKESTDHDLGQRDTEQDEAEYVAADDEAGPDSKRARV